MERHISDKFRKESLADAYVSVVLASAEEAREELDRFPAHLLVLTQSPYFQSQMNFAHGQEEQRSRDRSRSSSPARSSADAAVASRVCTRSRSRSSTRRDQDAQPDPLPLQRTTRPSSVNGTEKPTLLLTVSDRAHAPAAVATIAALYGVANALDTLQQEELLYVMQFADLIRVESIAIAAVAQFKAAATAGEGLTAGSMAALAAVTAWPSCMLPLIPLIAEHAAASDTTATATDAEAVGEGADTLSSRDSCLQQVLVTALGNLEAVWQQQDLTEILLELPLAAMKLLLLSDQLQVYSEDTVVLTVKRYIDRQRSKSFKRVPQARRQLSKLVRAPHLSDLQLAAHCCPDFANNLEAYRTELQHLQQLRRLKATEEELKAHFTEKHKKKQVPSSWLMGARRQLEPPADGHSVSLTWGVPISTLQALVAQSCEKRKTCSSRSCADLTPPLCGLQWKMWIGCKWDGEHNGVTLGAFTKPASFPRDAYCRFAYSLQSVVATTGPTVSWLCSGANGKGSDDVFGLGVMTNGWDGLAWAAKGLPTQGEVELKLTINGVW